MSVHCDNEDWVKRAKELLRRTGGDDVGSAGECGADFSVSDRPMPRLRRATMVDPLSAPDEVVPDTTEPLQRS
jgi:hypothetical protein